MSKVKLMLDVISDVRSLADSLQVLCDAMAETEATASVKEPAPANGQAAQKTEKKKANEIKLEDVRAKLADMSQAGKTAEVRDIIKKYGGTKLSDVDPVHYADILKDVEEAANGK